MANAEGAAGTAALRLEEMMKTMTAIFAALVLAGCSGTRSAPSASTTSGGSNKKSLKIAMIAKSSTNPVFLSAKKGAEDAAADLSKKEGVQVSVEWLSPPTEDGQVQAQTIAEAVNNGADAVLISCSDAAKVTNAINEAVDKGVPVMTFDSDAAQSKRFAFYGAADMEVGGMVMAELAKQCGGKANVAILAGNQNAPNLQNRVKGVVEEAKKYPGIKIVDTYYHVETPQDAAAEVLRVMKSNPEINAWAMVGGWPLFTKTLLTDLDPAKVKVVAVDCLPAQLPYIEKGIAPVLFAQPTYDWGRVSVETIFKKVIKGESVPVINKMELVKVDKASLSSWAQKLKDWGFNDVDPKYLTK